MPIQNQHFTINSDGYCEDENYGDDDSDYQAPTSFNFHQNNA